MPQGAYGVKDCQFIGSPNRKRMRKRVLAVDAEAEPRRACTGLHLS
jgi:hypothetical protein